MGDVRGPLACDVRGPLACDVIGGRLSVAQSLDGFDYEEKKKGKWGVRGMRWDE